MGERETRVPRWVPRLREEDLYGPDRAERIRMWMNRHGVEGVDPNTFDEYPDTFNVFRLGFIVGDSSTMQRAVFQMIDRRTPDPELPPDYRSRYREVYLLGVHARSELRVS